MNLNSDNTITLETRECSSCRWIAPGKVAGRKTCDACNGTGNGKRGGKNGCKSCHGFRTRPDHDNLVTCPNCKGTAIQPENWTDTTTGNVLVALLTLPITVRRSERGQTWNEAYLGLGSLYSVTDYGRHTEQTDAELIQSVRDDLGRHTQLCNVAEKAEDGTLTFAAGIVIDCSRNGYSVRAHFGTPLVAADDTADRAGEAIGHAVYKAGGNGTLAAGLSDHANLVPLTPQ